MSKLKYLILHCTATHEGQEVTKDDIVRWHTGPKPKGRGWKKVGYTDLIQLDGTIVNLSPFDQDDDVDGFEITNGVRGMNGKSRHIVYSGGLKKHNMDAMDTRTLDQLRVMEIYVKYMVARHPHILVCGHNQFDNKACPSFDVAKWCDIICLAEKNILRGKQY